METDERLGLPSASSMHRAALCPGSVALEAQCPPEPPGPDAERGTRIHRWLSHGDAELMTDDECETASACVEMQHEALSTWAGPMPAHVINREQRLWLKQWYDPNPPTRQCALRPICSGQPDVVYTQGNRALVIDYKTGFAEPDAAEVNMQLRTLAVLVAENSDGEIDEVTCCIVAPNVSREVSLVTYTTDDLLQAREEILAICEATKAPDAPRIPSENACRYCRGKLRCPEAQASMDLVCAFQHTAISAPVLAAFLDSCSIAKHIIKAVEDEAKSRLLTDPNSVPGWTLKEGAKVRHVADAEGVYNALEGHVNHEGFLSCVEVKIGALEKLVVENTTDCFPTKKAARENFNECAAPYITTTQNAPSLKRVKALPE